MGIDRETANAAIAAIFLALVILGIAAYLEMIGCHTTAKIDPAIEARVATVESEVGDIASEVGAVNSKIGSLSSGKNTGLINVDFGDTTTLALSLVAAGAAGYLIPGGTRMRKAILGQK